MFDNISIIISAGALIVSIISLFLNRKQARQANTNAAEANRIAKTAKDISRKALYAGYADAISTFEITLGDPHFPTEYTQLPLTIKEAEIIPIDFDFHIKNISDKRASFVRLINDRTSSQLGYSGETIEPGQAVSVKYTVYANQKTRIEEYSNFNDYEFKKRLNWDNGIYACSCDIIFALRLKERGDKCDVCCNAKECRVDNIKVALPELDPR